MHYICIVRQYLRQNPTVMISMSFTEKNWEIRKVNMLITQSCLTLCEPVDCSLPGSSVHGILQARIWSRLPFPPPGDLPDQGIGPGSPALQADSSWSERYIAIEHTLWIKFFLQIQTRNWNSIKVNCFIAKVKEKEQHCYIHENFHENHKRIFIYFV